MKTDRDRYFIPLSDGTDLRRTEFLGHITEVTVPFGGNRRCIGHGLRRDQDALVFSVLVVPTSAALVTTDLGVLEFSYNDRPHLVAPVRALMNRYAGLTRLAQLQERLRLAGLLLNGMDEWDRDVVFAHPMVEPVHMRENLEFVLRHTAPHDQAACWPETLTIEIQAVIKNPIAGEDFFRWELLA